MDGAQTPDFIDLRTRAEFLALCGDADAARRLEQQALDVAREIDLVCYAYQLLWRARIDDALDLLRYAVSTHPDSWNAHHSLAEAFEHKGEFAMAIAHYREALNRVDDDNQRRIIERRLVSLTDLATAC